MLKDDSEVENHFKAAPLSNRERLILRKQALKMRNRPVLAVGNYNFYPQPQIVIHVILVS